MGSASIPKLQYSTSKLLNRLTVNPQSISTYMTDQLFSVYIIITAFLPHLWTACNMADASWHFVHLRPLCRHPVMKWRFTWPRSFAQNSLWKHTRFTLWFSSLGNMATDSQRPLSSRYEQSTIFMSLATLTDDTQREIKSSLAEKPPGFSSRWIWNVVVRSSSEHLPSVHVNETMCTQLEVTAERMCLQLDRNSC